jgi:RIP metalloprotease RseP
MTDQRERASGSSGQGAADPRAEESSARPTDNPILRWAVLAALGALVAYGLLSGSVGGLLTVAVLVPVLAALVLSELDRDGPSRIARIVAVVGLFVWLAVTGGLAMILVVTTVILMIFLHELGHYMAAKRAGMKVTEFFLGFGTRLWSFKRGETEFGLKAIPAGAYVKIIGMNNLEEVDPADEARTYRQAPFRSRFSVAVAGSAMHFALALVLLVVQFAAFGRADEAKWVIGDLTEGGAAQQAGLDRGDRVVSFNGEPVGTFDEFREQIGGATGEVVVEVERDGERSQIPVELIRRGKIIGTVGTDVDVLEVPDGLFVGPLMDNSRGERAGLETGQQILAVNGADVESLDELADAVSSSTAGEVELSVAGGPAVGGESVVVDLGSAVATTEPTAFLGVGVEHDLERESLPVAIGSSVTEFGRGVGASVVGIGTVFNPPRLLGFLTDTVTGGEQDVTDEPTPAEQVAISSDAGRPTSIIGAVAYGADMTAQNLSNLIGFMIALNIFIGVFNLIPLLPFDGGHIAIAVYEKIRELASGSKKRYIADITRMIPVAYGVVMVLAVVGLLAMYLDLTLGVSA